MSVDLSSKLLSVPRLFIGGLPIAVINRGDSARLIIDIALARRQFGSAPVVISSANGQVVSLCAREPRIHALFRSCDMLHADGMSLVFASRLRCTTPLPERVATTDLFHDVARMAERSAISFYLLGATAEVIAEAAARARKRYPELQIVGHRSGYFDTHEENEIVAEINAAHPDILWVGMGVPFEQSFCLRNRERLTNVGVIKTSGGLFDFISGQKSRAPIWMQAGGLEWLYRLIIEPRRLMMRYMTTNLHALYLLLARTSKLPLQRTSGVVGR